MFDTFPQLCYRGNVVTEPPHRGIQLMFDDHCLLESFHSFHRRESSPEDSGRQTLIDIVTFMSDYRRSFGW
jgi:hypothetical protein